MATVRSLACPSCFSRGVRPCSEAGSFDWLFRLAGRTPYRCLWCRKRSFLVAPQNGENRVRPTAVLKELESTSLRPAVRPRREAPVPEPLPVHAEKGRLRHEHGEKLPEAVTMTIEPEPAPAPPRTEIRVPDAPPMYAEKGRLRLSGITLEQIQWRDSKVRRSRSSPRGGEESNA